MGRSAGVESDRDRRESDSGTRRECRVSTRCPAPVNGPGPKPRETGMRHLKIGLSLLLVSLAAACGNGGSGKNGPRQGPPLVRAEPALTVPFVETIQAVGTGLANEQVTLAAPVTERIVRLGFDDGSF